MNETKLRVVIVEDSPMIRARLVEGIAEIANVEIVGYAESEKGAVDLLRGGDWDAVILDLQLKAGTGLGVLKTIPVAQRPAHAKIIIFTNYAFAQYRARSLSLGADFFFDKARDFESVRDLLADMAIGNRSTPH